MDVLIVRRTGPISDAAAPLHAPPGGDGIIFGSGTTLTSNYTPVRVTVLADGRLCAANVTPHVNGDDSVSFSAELQVDRLREIWWSGTGKWAVPADT